MGKIKSEIDLIRIALAEDIGTGDITTAALHLRGKKGEAVVVAKASGVISGTAPFSKVYARLSPIVMIKCLKRDGKVVVPGDEVIRLRGPLGPILTGERTAMNIISHLSGVATLTAEIASQVIDLPVKILDTRKTTPGMRHWEKLAVRHGGATNHRFGLFDMYLIKENHITAAGGIVEAMEKVAYHKVKTRAKIEVEVKNLEELEIALNFRADIILLDNFPLNMLKKAVELAGNINPAAILEASGNVSAGNIRAIAQTGVGRISIGRITHSAPALDLSMKIVERG